MEIADKDPWFVEGLRYTGEQIKVLFLSFVFQITLEKLLLQGACLVPKRALNVMTGEVNRVLQLANTSIIPITWQVPRKSYHEFHADIFPASPGPVAAMGPQDWLQGNDYAPDKISLGTLTQK